MDRDIGKCWRNAIYLDTRETGKSICCSSAALAANMALVRVEDLGHPRPPIAWIAIL